MKWKTALQHCWIIVGCRNTEPWPCSACSVNNPFIFHLGAPERILDCCSSFLNAEGQVSISTLYMWGWYECSICLTHTIVRAKGRDSLQGSNPHTGRGEGWVGLESRLYFRELVGCLCINAWNKCSNTTWEMLSPLHKPDSTGEKWKFPSVLWTWNLTFHWPFSTNPVEDRAQCWMCMTFGSILYRNGAEQSMKCQLSCPQGQMGNFILCPAIFIG